MLVVLYQSGIRARRLGRWCVMDKFWKWMARKEYGKDYLMYFPNKLAAQIPKR